MIITYRNFITEKFRRLPKLKNDYGDKSGIGYIIRQINSNRGLPSNDSVDGLKKILNRICSKWGLSGKPKYLNAGSYGITFAIGDKVIKITSSLSEFKVAKRMMEVKYDHVVKYYKAMEIEPKTPKSYGIYAILMQKIRTLTNAESSIVDFIFDNRYQYDEGIKYLISFSKSLERQYDKLMNYYSDKGLSEEKAMRISDDYVELTKYLKSNNLSYGDAHGLNVGYVKDKMVIFDINQLYEI